MKYSEVDKRALVNRGIHVFKQEMQYSEVEKRAFVNRGIHVFKQ